MKAKYGLSRDAWAGFNAEVRGILARGTGRKSVLELGAGANPSILWGDVNGMEIDYWCLDISPEEAQKAGSSYRFLIGDIGSPNLELPHQFDFVFSKMLAEHIRSGQVFHSNVAKLLRPGGKAFHFFPTMYAPPYLLNRILPEHLSERVLSLLQPGKRRKDGRNAKFPAYYSWCRGPSKNQYRKFESVGLRVDRYVGFFGHEDYYNRLPLLKAAHMRLCDFLVRNPISLITSFAYVELTRVR